MPRFKTLFSVALVSLYAMLLAYGCEGLPTNPLHPDQQYP